MGRDYKAPRYHYKPSSYPAMSLQKRAFTAASTFIRSTAFCTPDRYASSVSLRGSTLLHRLLFSPPGSSPILLFSESVIFLCTALGTPWSIPGTVNLPTPMLHYLSSCIIFTHNIPRTRALSSLDDTLSQHVSFPCPTCNRQGQGRQLLALRESSFPIRVVSSDLVTQISPLFLIGTWAVMCFFLFQELQSHTHTLLALPTPCAATTANLCLEEDTCRLGLFPLLPRTVCVDKSKVQRYVCPLPSHPHPHDAHLPPVSMGKLSV